MSICHSTFKHLIHNTYMQRLDIGEMCLGIKMFEKRITSA